MYENFISNNTEHDESYLNTQERDYKNLIIRLQEIRATIAILEKTIFR